MATPSQAFRPNGRCEGVETRRAAPKARTRYGEGIVQTTNSSRRERADEAAQAVAGTKIRWGKPRAGSIPAARTTPFRKWFMTDQTHLNELIAAMSKKLSRKLVETFRDSSRDPSIARTDYVQHLKNEMEAALQEGLEHEATQSNDS